MVVKEFVHELKESFKYSHKGEFCDADLITVGAPKGDMMELSFIDGLCIRAERRALKDVAGLLEQISGANESELRQKQQEIESQKDLDQKALDAYNNVFSGLEAQEIKQFHIAFKELLKKSAIIDGEKSFEDSFYNELSVTDKRLIIGNYIVNFTSTSH